MKILFEEYTYRTEALSSILSERYYLPINSHSSKIHYVGYYFNSIIDSDRGDSVIIFPKVFLNEDGKAFGKYHPEDLINIKKTDPIYLEFRSTRLHKIIFEISTWMYRAIQQYNKRQINNTIKDSNNINYVISNLDDKSITELDLILSLLNFYKNNKELITYIFKVNYSQKHKINWTKTITKRLPFIQDDIFIYPEVISRKKTINFDEELLIIFYSTLNYIKTKYGFEIQLNGNYGIYKGKEFEKLLISGTKRLKKIKYKYFSDKLLHLWNLLYAFFERSEAVKNQKQIEEILLIKDFNFVFEDMIDDLIAENNTLIELKYHRDGKRLDHIYSYKSLIVNDDIYYVGDSKYYKPENNIDIHSKAKQFTYAKNVIQYNIDLFNKGKSKPNIRYRDDNLTEGYNITPNFFISAFVEETFNFQNHYLTETPNTSSSYHFPNRLFDRDTLILQSYSINFLFVLSAYISRNSVIKSDFKNETRQKFRSKLIEYFNIEYNFYLLKSKSNEPLENIINNNFKLLNGKIYRASQMSDSVILALSKEEISLLDLPEYKTLFEVYLSLRPFTLE